MLDTNQTYRVHRRGAKRKGHRHPTRQQCEAIIRTVAAKHGISESDLIHSPRNVIATVRHETWSEIIRITGCSQVGLAMVWGVDNAAVIHGLRKHQSHV